MGWQMVRRGKVPAFLVVIVAFVSSCSSDHHILRGAGRGGAQIAFIGWFMIILSTVIGVGFLGLFAWAIFRGGRRSPWRRESAVVVAGGIFLPLAVIGTLTYMTLDTLHGRDEPADLKIQVTGHQYWWEVSYRDPDFTTANEIRIPVGEPVEFELISDDVIHSFWVPGLDGKMDMVPGRRNHMTITAERAGSYRGQCAEFCGLQHANMAFVIDAVSAEDYRKWTDQQAAEAKQPTDESARAGEEAFLRLPCASCHTIRGTSADGKRGPDLTHLATRRTLGAGAIPNSRGSLGGWITNSQAIKPGNLMPAIPLSADELRHLIDYLGGLS